MTTRTLLRSGHVISMDPDIGDLPHGDVLVEDGRITAVEPEISADAEVLDMTGRIVIPGFVDTHRHTWEAPIRGVAPDATLDDYFVDILDTFAPLYTPEDVYAGNLAGALECLNAGITTLVDWSHINNTPEHPDAAIQGLAESGIRAQYAYGSANTSLAEYWFESRIAIPAERAKEFVAQARPLMAGGPLLCAAGTCVDEVVAAEWAMARELGLPITVHVAMGRLAGRFGMVKQLHGLGLLGPDTTYVHSCHLSGEEWRMVADSGGTVSVAPQVELQMGHGWPPVMQAIEHGLRPALSIDVVTTVPGDMFTQIRAAFGAERARVNADCWQANMPVPSTMLTARQMLEIATVNGAHVAGLEDRTGSLTPGKRADIVAIDATAPNVAPVHDAAAAVTLCADVSNVDTVLVDGVLHKRDGRLLGDTARALRLVGEARDRLLAAKEAKGAKAPA